MEAQEYFDKYETALISELESVDFEKYGKTMIEDLSDDEFKATKGILEDMIDEMRDICVAKEVTDISNFLSVLAEMNQKWNAICKLYEDKYHYSPLKKDGLKNHWILCFPEFEKVI